MRHVGSEHCDVVAGWGSAGAAVGAGQAGARTLLLEAAGCLAGAATLTYHDHTAAAAAFVDATGERDLAWFAGASTRYGNHGCVQPRALYREVMTGTGKEHLVTSIASHVKAGVKPEVMPRVIKYRASVHPDPGAQAATQLTGS